MSEDAGVQRAAIPITVLVVEDEESTRKLCAEVAESCGMKSMVAGTVEEALRRLETSAVDIVVTDLILPPSSGLDLLKQVHEMYPQIAVVVLTQYGTIDSAVAATRMGAVDYVTKPFHVEGSARAARPGRLRHENARTGRAAFLPVVGAREESPAATVFVCDWRRDRPANPGIPGTKSSSSRGQTVPRRGTDGESI